MFFKQLATKESSLSYFFGCGTKGKSMAVDVVAGDEEWFIEEAKKANVTINYVIDTHVHADHYSGGRKLAQMVGAPYCLHESDKGLVKFEFRTTERRSVAEPRQRRCRGAAYTGPYAGQHLPAGDRHASRRVALVRAHRRHAVRRLHRPPRPCWGASGRWPHSSTTASIPSCCICPMKSKSSPAIRQAASAVRDCPASHLRPSASRNAGIRDCR